MNQDWNPAGFCVLQVSSLFLNKWNYIFVTCFFQQKGMSSFFCFFFHENCWKLQHGAGFMFEVYCSTFASGGLTDDWWLLLTWTLFVLRVCLTKTFDSIVFANVLFILFAPAPFRFVFSLENCKILCLIPTFLFIGCCLTFSFFCLEYI